MSYFRNIALLKAPIAYDLPSAQYVTDLIEVCNLAAMVEKDVDSVRIPVDFYNDKAYEEFEVYLRQHPVDLVAISSMTGAYNNALRLAEMAKKADKFVVMGGYHPSALPGEVLQSPFVDAVVIGEGEATFRDFVLNGPSRDVPGMAIKIDGDVVFTGERPLIEDLDTIPLPLRSARPSRFGEDGDKYSIDTIYTSRGCPRQCSFCANNIVNKRWRARSPENIIEEISLLHDPKRKKLLKLWDANFLTNIKRIEKLCDLMIEKGLTNFKICVETGVNDIIRAEKIMPKLHQVGIRHIGLGIESPNKETLKLMNKKITGDECTRAVEILKENNIKAQGFFIIGHYTETKEDTRKYPEYAKALGLHNALFMVITPYPGTQIYNDYKKENRIKSYNWDLYNNFGTTVETKSMDSGTLKMMHAYCWGKFYVNNAFMHNSRPLGIAAKLLQKLTTFYLIFRFDKTNTVDEIKDYLYAFLDAACGDYSRKRPKKPSPILYLFKEFHMRFVRSPEQMIDMTIYRSNDMQHLIVRQAEKNTKPKGIVMEIDRIIKLGESMPNNRLVALASKFEIAKNITSDSALRFKKYLYLAFDRDIFKSGYNLVRFAIPVLTGGIINMSVKSAVSLLSGKQAEGN